MGVFLLLLKGSIYRCLIKYRPIGERATITIKNKKIKQDLDAWLLANPQALVPAIVGFAQEYSTQGIAYTFEECPTDPNKIQEAGYTNCIGYSAFMQAVVQYLIEKRGGAARVSCSHKIGQLYFFGVNMHPFFKNAAFRDHDFNVIVDGKTSVRYVLDPTVWAVLGIGRVEEK